MSSVTCRLATIRPAALLAFTSIKNLINRGPVMWSSKHLLPVIQFSGSGFFSCCSLGSARADVVRMKWGDIREYDGQEEIWVVQEKTGTKIWVPLHRDLKALLDVTPHASDYILNSTWGRPFASSQSLYEKIKQVLKRTGNGDYVPHGLRATAAVRLIEEGCSEDQAAAITGHRNMNVLRG